MGLRSEKFGPRPQITRISPTPEAPPGEMLLMKRVWMGVKNVWIFAKTRILHYPPLNVGGFRGPWFDTAT
jgi:hypothetical protein